MEITCDIAGEPCQQVQHGAAHATRYDRRSHRSQRSSDTQQQQVGPDTPEVLEDSGGRSPLITWDLDLYPQPPTNTHSPTLNSEEPV